MNPVEAVAQAITGVEIDPIDTDGGYAIPESEAYRLAALVVASLELREEWGIRYGNGEMRTWVDGRPVAWDDRAAAQDRLDFVHCIDEPHWQNATLVRRWVSSWTSGSED